MRSTNEYIQQAKHNADLASHLRQTKTDCLDWAATCLFYAAIHYVNAYLVKVDIPLPKRHFSKKHPNPPGRSNIIQNDSVLALIYSEYRHLEDESRDARYELRIPSTIDFDTFLFPQLEMIRALILRQVKP